MRLDRRLTSLFAALTCVASLLAGPAAAETERNVQLDYEVYVGGFETIRITFETELRPYVLNEAWSNATLDLWLDEFLRTGS